MEDPKCSPWCTDTYNSRWAWSQALDSLSICTSWFQPILISSHIKSINHYDVVQGKSRGLSSDCGSEVYARVYSEPVTDVPSLGFAGLCWNVQILCLTYTTRYCHPRVWSWTILWLEWNMCQGWSYASSVNEVVPLGKMSVFLMPEVD